MFDKRSSNTQWTRCAQPHVRMFDKCSSRNVHALLVTGKYSTLHALHNVSAAPRLFQCREVSKFSPWSWSKEHLWGSLPAHSAVAKAMAKRLQSLAHVCIFTLMYLIWNDGSLLLRPALWEWVNEKMACCHIMSQMPGVLCILYTECTPNGFCWYAPPEQIYILWLPL